MFTAILAYLISDLEEDGIGGLTVGPTSSLVLLRFVDWVAIVCEEACLPVIVYAAGADAKVEKGKSKKKIQRETTRDQDYVTSVLLSLAEFTEKNQLSKMHHASGYTKDGTK